MKKETVFALSAILSVALFALIVSSAFFAGAPEKEIDQSSANSIENMKDVTLLLKSSSAPKAHAISTLKKEDVVNAMLNSVDYYQSVQGEFTTSSLHDHQETTVAYKTDLAAGNSYQHILDSEADIEQYVKGGILTQYDNKTKSYSQSYVPIQSESEDKTGKTLEARITVEADGIKNYHYRYDSTHTGISTMSLFPQEMTFGLLADTDLWEITGQTEYLGRSCVALSGEATPFYGEKLDMERFTMYVDEETGILLKFEGFSSKGQLTQSITTKSISIDSPSLSDQIDQFINSQLSRAKYNGYAEMGRLKN